MEQSEEQKKVEQLRKDYKEVFSSEEGDRVLEDLKKVCFFYQPAINEIAHIMAYNDGMRSVVLHINTMIKLDAIKLKELENARQAT